MSTDAYIVARLGSTRLPKKNMKDVAGKPMISRLNERLSMSKQLDRIIIVTSTQNIDDELEQFADENNILCYRGDLDNVMKRIIDAAEYYKTENIVEILGDNPLVHAELVDDVVNMYKDGSYDYCASVTTEYKNTSTSLRRFPLGIRVQAYKTSVAKDYINHESETDAYTSFIYNNNEQYKVGLLEAEGKWASLNRENLNFAVNYGKNFSFVEKAFEEFYEGDKNFSLQNVIKMIDKKPGLADLLGPE